MMSSEILRVTLLHLMSPSGNGRKSLAFRRSREVDDPLAPPAKAGGLKER